MKVGIASDHAGTQLRAAVIEHLRAAGHEVVDRNGPNAPDDDYPVLVVPLARAVAQGEVERGIFCCGSGIGPAVAANKIPGVRASVATDEWSARDAVSHVDVNLLTLGQRVLGVEVAKAIVDAFLAARPEGGRHARRRGQIAMLEAQPSAIVPPARRPRGKGPTRSSTGARARALPEGGFR